MAAPSQETWTILKVLDWTRSYFEQKALGAPRLDAELIIAHALGLQRVMLYAHFDRPLTDAERDGIRGLVARRARGEPMAHLLGTKEFWSLELEVTKDTLIPRPDTETLVEVALRRLGDAEAPVIVDVGTGTGAVAFAFGTERPSARVFGLEVSPAALEVARRNAERLGLQRVTLLESDLLASLPDEPIDLLVANLPYIATLEMQTLMQDVRDFEPHLALDGGPDGLDPIRRLLEQAPKRMRPGGLIALEAGADQLPEVAHLLEAADWTDVETHRDAGGLLRVASARWPA